MSRGDGLWQDGGRLQGWLKRRTEVRTRSRTQGFRSTELGLILARYYPDSDNSQNSVMLEYDVYVPRYQITLERLTQLLPYQGIAGGQQVTLKVAEGRPNASNPNDHWRQIMESDGDLVAIDWIGETWPVITGCMNHIRESGATDWYTDSGDGEVLSTTYNTTRARINSDGNIEIDLDDTEAPPDRSLVIRAGSKVLMTISYDDGASEVRVELGSGSVEKLVLGESFKTWWDSNVPSHVHSMHAVVTDASVAGGPGHSHTFGIVPPVPSDVGPSDVPNLPDSGPDNVLTEKAKAEK